MDDYNKLALKAVDLQKQNKSHEAKKIYIYMRDEYPGIRLKMIDELKKLGETNIIDTNTKIYIFFFFISCN